jgi:hypothetical protein
LRRAGDNAEHAVDIESGSDGDGSDDDTHISGTLRHKNCLRVEDRDAGVATFNRGICARCAALPGLHVLRKRVIRLSERKAGPHTNTNIRYLNNHELVERARHLREEKRAAVYQVKTMWCHCCTHAITISTRAC